MLEDVADLGLDDVAFNGVKRLGRTRRKMPASRLARNKLPARRVDAEEENANASSILQLGHARVSAFRLTNRFLLRKNTGLSISNRGFMPSMDEANQGSSRKKRSSNIHRGASLPS